ncbi:MAG TPA: PhnD/SsuA/transferrin family substrate-binding protein [Geobacteraceae bacterium]
MRIKLSAFLAGSFLLALSLSVHTGFPAEKPVVYFGIGMRYRPSVVYERFQPMMDYLTQNTPYRFELKISRNPEETIRFLKEGQTPVSVIEDGGLMEAMLRYGAVPILKPLNAEGQPSYRCYFIVPAASPLRSLAELKGKKVAFGSRHSTTGNLIPRKMLWDSGIRVKALGSYANLDNQDAVMRGVLSGKYDAGAVKSTVAWPYKEHGVRVLATSEELPSVPLLVGKNAPKELVQVITGALVKLNRRDPRYRRIMENWDVEYKYGFVPATAADYRDIARMFRAIPYGCGTGCHK